MLDILIADDDSALLETLQACVERLGYTVRGVPDGESALRAYEEKPADIVVTDWTMPRLTGLELCSRIKSTESPPYLILMTASGEGKRLVEGMRAGADDFLRKPIDLDELDVRLLAASRLVHQRQNLAEQNVRLKHDSERAIEVARIDPLTGVFNRLALDEELERTLSNTARYARTCSLAMCDVDYFKHYNDRYGHVAGDAALKRVASVIRDTIRSGDTVFRFGGEEFVVILPEQSVAEAVCAMERVRAAVEAARIPHPTVSLSGVLTISAGVAGLGGGLGDWLERADAALYRAKEADRNCVRAEPATRPSLLP